MFWNLCYPCSFSQSLWPRLQLLDNGRPMIGIVTAKTTAAGGAPTSALAVESESKHGGSEGLCRVLQIFSLVSALEYLISPLCSVNHWGRNGTGLFFLWAGHLPRQCPGWRQLWDPASVAAPAALAPSVAPSPPPAAQLVQRNSCEDALAVISAVRPRGRL